MTTQDILNQYNIKFINNATPNPLGVKTIRKSFINPDAIGWYFDVEFRDPDSINEDILPIVNYFIAGNNPALDDNDAELGGSANYALPYLDAVRFHNPSNGEIVQTVPINDFKIIAQAWRDFLSSSPFNGTIL
jgi:hypothetical protein